MCMKRLFRVRFEDGSCIFIISRAGWSGIIPIAQRMIPQESKKIYLSQVSLLDLIKYIIKGD